jgi:adenylylsulfate kinase
MKTILICGLPGAGKTTLAYQLNDKLITAGFTVEWLNADKIREEYNDWDFSRKGRINHSKRMHELSRKCNTDFVICDFVAPIPEMRDNFNADYVIWVDTIEESRYEDTNRMFVPPEVYDFRVSEQNAEKWSKLIVVCIRALHKFDSLKHINNV